MQTIGIDLGYRRLGLALTHREPGDEHDSLSYTALVQAPAQSDVLDALNYQAAMIEHYLEWWRPETIGIEEFTYQGKLVTIFGAMNILAEHLRTIIRKTYNYPETAVRWWRSTDWKPQLYKGYPGANPHARTRAVVEHRLGDTLPDEFSWDEIDAIGVSLVTRDVLMLDERLVKG